MPDAVAITTTGEYQAFTDPTLIWRWGLRVTPEEAALACTLMLEAMRGGAAVDWQMEALRYLEEARARLGKAAPAGPVAAVAYDDGELAGGGLESDEAPLVCEQGETAEAPPTIADHDETAGTAHHDPGLPGVAELLDEAEEMARDLQGQGDREDSFARRLVELVVENRKLLVTVGLLVGGYVVATKFVGGKLVITWSANATGVVFERHLARSLRPTAELEEGLRKLQSAKAEIRRVGSGLNWKVQRERWDLDAYAQIDENACGPACIEMVLGDRGVQHPPQSMIAGMARGGVGAPVPTDALRAQDTLSKIDPAGSWQSDLLRNPDSERWQEIARAMSDTGTWIADVRESFDEGAVGHAVVVDGVGADGTVSIRDPWPVKGGERGLTGTAYQVTWDEFFRHWSGVHTFSPRGKR